MPRIAVDRHVIVPAGQVPAGVAMHALEGDVHLVVQHEGVRMTVLLDPDEATALGVGGIQCAIIAGQQRQAAAERRVKPVIVDGGRA